MGIDYRCHAIQESLPVLSRRLRMGIPVTGPWARVGRHFVFVPLLQEPEGPREGLQLSQLPVRLQWVWGQKLSELGD